MVAKCLYQTLFTNRTDAQGTAVEFAFGPALAQGQLQYRRSQCSTEVGAPLAPVQAGAGEAAALALQRANVDTERRHGGCACWRETVIVFLCDQAALRAQLVVQRDSDRAGHMVIASTRMAQTVWRTGHEGLACYTGHHQQRFQRLANLGAGQPVVAVLALRNDRQQAVVAQAAQMGAGRGSAYLGQR